MLNLIQHLTKSRAYETLKQVQGDKSGLFTRPSKMNLPAASSGVSKTKTGRSIRRKRRGIYPKRNKTVKNKTIQDPSFLDKKE